MTNLKGTCTSSGPGATFSGVGINLLMLSWLPAALLGALIVKIVNRLLARNRRGAAEIRSQFRNRGRYMGQGQEQRR